MSLDSRFGRLTNLGQNQEPRLIYDFRISICNRSSLFRVSTLHHVEVVACRALALDLAVDCIYQSLLFFHIFSPFFQTGRRLFLVLPWVLTRRVEHASSSCFQEATNPIARFGVIFYRVTNSVKSRCSLMSSARTGF